MMKSKVRRVYWWKRSSRAQGWSFALSHTRCFILTQLSRESRQRLWMVTLHAWKEKKKEHRNDKREAFFALFLCLWEISFPTFLKKEKLTKPFQNLNIFHTSFSVVKTILTVALHSFEHSSFLIMNGINSKRSTKGFSKTPKIISMGVVALQKEMQLVTEGFLTKARDLICMKEGIEDYLNDQHRGCSPTESDLISR